jgi:hypothetical protein
LAYSIGLAGVGIAGLPENSWQWMFEVTSDDEDTG